MKELKNTCSGVTVYKIVKVQNCLEMTQKYNPHYIPLQQFTATGACIKCMKMCMKMWTETPLHYGQCYQHIMQSTMRNIPEKQKQIGQNN